jgi:hypothetical protein
VLKLPLRGDYSSKNTKIIKIINPKDIKNSTSMTPVNLKFGVVCSPQKYSKNNSGAIKKLGKIYNLPNNLSIANINIKAHINNSGFTNVGEITKNYETEASKIQRSASKDPPKIDLSTLITISGNELGKSRNYNTQNKEIQKGESVNNTKIMKTTQNHISSASLN